MEEIKDKLTEHDFNEFISLSRIQKYKWVFLIDLDQVLEPASRRIRNQFYEASQLFRKSGCDVLVYTTLSQGSFVTGNFQAFTNVFWNIPTKESEKIECLLQKLKQVTDVDCNVFIFADELANKMKPINKAMGFDVRGTNFLRFDPAQNPYLKYSVVECMMFFLALLKGIDNIYTAAFNY